MTPETQRGLGTGWVIAIVAIGVVVVVGIAVGAFALLSRGSGDEATGKYGSAPLPSCDYVASRVKDLPPKSSETEISPRSGWICGFTNSADAVSVHLDVEVKTVQQQRSGFELYTSSGGYVPDATVHLGENAAWGPSGTGKLCTLAVWDSNAKFKVDLDDGTLTAADTQACRDRVKPIAQSFYEAMQPR